MKIAVEGCAHGELENIYRTIHNVERRDNIKVDLLICCGDFQSTRNLADLQTMAVPNKFKDIGSFYKYYSGELVAPFLTIFIGGNHEASNYLQELPYGGWVAPNIYYLGYAGVICVNGLRIAGISGIYKGHDFLRGHHEFSPYSQSSIRSVYHVRQLEVFRLKQISGDIDIFISHDWPRGIYNFGNKEQLIRFKRHFRDEIYNNQLGSRPCEDLLYTIKPEMWFAAHLHCQFSAEVPHDYDDDNETPAKKECYEANQTEDNSSKEKRSTKFLALDKCLPGRRFLQILDVDAKLDSSMNNSDSDESSSLKVEYDLEWLAILQHTNHLLSVKNSTYYMPGPRSCGNEERYNFTPTEEELSAMRNKFSNDLRIPNNFCYTVPAYDPKQQHQNIMFIPQPNAQINPQTTQFCDKLGIDDPVSLAMVIGGHELNHSVVLDNSSSSLNESSQSFSSDLNVSVNRWDISTCSEGSPVQRKCNISLNLPAPISASDTDSPPLVSPVKRERLPNPEEVELSASDDEDYETVKTTKKDVIPKTVETNTRVVESSESDSVKVLKGCNDESVNIDCQDTEEASVESSAISTVTEVSDYLDIKFPGKLTSKVFKRRNQSIYNDIVDDED